MWPRRSGPVCVIVAVELERTPGAKSTHGGTDRERCNEPGGVSHAAPILDTLPPRTDAAAVRVDARTAAWSFHFASLTLCGVVMRR
jgi:hypothetical protein